KGYVQLLLSLLEQEHQDLNTLPVKPSLKRIDEQVARLTRLISEILDLSRIEESRLDLKKKKLNLNELVEETIEDINRTEIEHCIEIEQEASFEVEVDKDRIGQVIINLVTNAVKYSPEKKNVKVRIYESKKGEVAISVTDKGI
ncbi:ATP-binding protein, partial [Tamlana crocina]